MVVAVIVFSVIDRLSEMSTAADGGNCSHVRTTPTPCENDITPHIQPPHIKPCRVARTTNNETETETTSNRPTRSRCLLVPSHVV
jgi:hypothetical protein